MLPSLVVLKFTQSHCMKWYEQTKLVSWYFEPSQAQRITSGLKQISVCLLFTLHSSHQPTISPKNTKSVPTQSSPEIVIIMYSLKLKERLLIRQNRTEPANFRATYNNTTENS